MRTISKFFQMKSFHRLPGFDGNQHCFFAMLQSQPFLMFYQQKIQPTASAINPGSSTNQFLLLNFIVIILL